MTFFIFSIWLAGPILQINSDKAPQIGYPVDAIVYQKTLFVLDQGEDRVLVYSLDGQFLRSFGAKGPGPEEFGNAPEHISIWGGELIIIESQKWYFHKYRPDGTFISKTKRTPSMIYLGELPVFERYSFPRDACTSNQYRDLENKCSLGTVICDDGLGLHLDDSLIQKDPTDGLTYIVKRRGEVEVYEKCRKITEYYVNVEKFKAEVIPDRLGNMFVAKMDPSGFRKFQFGLPIYDFNLAGEHIFLLVEEEAFQTRDRVPGKTTLIVIAKKTGHPVGGFPFGFGVSKINISEGYLCATSRDEALINIYRLSDFL